MTTIDSVSTSPGLAAAAALAPQLAERAADHDRDGSFPVQDFADLRDAGLFGLMVPTAPGRSRRRLRRLRPGRDTSWPGQRRDGAGVQHARLGHRRAGRHPGRAGPGAGRTRSRLRRPGPDPAPRGGRGAVRGGDERARRRLAAVAADHHVRTGGRRLPHQGRQVVRVRRRARRRLPGGGPDARGRAAWCRSSWSRPAPGLRVEPTWDSLGMRATGTHDLHLDVVVAGRRAARRGRGAGPAGRPGHAALAGRQLRRGLRRGGAGLRRRGGRRTAGARAGRTCRRYGPGSAGPTRRSRPPGSWCGGGPPGRRGARRRRRPTAGSGGPSCWPAQTAMDVAASMLEAAGTSATRRGHPLERLFRDARCGSLQPATSDVCADWLGVAALGGDPDPDGAAPRW